MARGRKDLQSLSLVLSILTDEGFSCQTLRKDCVFLITLARSRAIHCPFPNNNRPVLLLKPSPERRQFCSRFNSKAYGFITLIDEQIIHITASIHLPCQHNKPPWSRCNRRILKFKISFRPRSQSCLPSISHVKIKGVFLKIGNNPNVMPSIDRIFGNLTPRLSAMDMVANITVIPVNVRTAPLVRLMAKIVFHQHAY